MATEIIDKWKFVGGSVPVDFTNSAAGRVRQNAKDPLDYIILKNKLESYSDLLSWGYKAGIIDENSFKKLSRFAHQNEQAASKIYQRAINLREAIYHILICLINELKPKEEDLELLNSECTAARKHQKLQFESGKFKWDFDLQDSEPGIIVWQIALSASELLTSDQLHRLKQCPGNDCGWLFLDTSKNGSRQWCDMKDCGNLAKVRKFREKQK